MSAKISPSKPHQPLLFCGIDIAKDKHVACVIDEQAAVIVKSHTFTNNAEGYQQILARLEQIGGAPRITIAMEATGHYWYSLHECLISKGYQVHVFNPIQTAQQAKKGIRKTQTDRIDARHIADLLKNGEGRPALVPGELGMTCRQLSRLHHTMVRQESRIKQMLWGWIHPAWPEYEPLFANAFCKTARTLLVTAPTPADILELQPEALQELLSKTSRGRYGPAQGDKIRKAAMYSVGMRRGLTGTRAGIRLLLQQIDALQPIRQQLETQIQHLANQLPDYLLSLPGTSPMSAVSLFGETDPIEAFRSASQLVAFAGFDPVVAQSGQPPAQEPPRRISKRGSPYLRKTLWQITFRALQQEGELREYWLRKRRQGAHHLAAVAATTIKMCHVTWRILIDRRNYLPEPPTRPS